MSQDKLLEEINEKILAHYLELDDTGNFKNPPSNNDELWEFIHLAFKAKIPRKVVEPGHKAPFDFIADLFFERVKNALAFANRNGSKTFCTAILNMLDMLFKPGCEIASAGAVKDQAKKAYKYFVGFMQYKWFKDFCEDFKSKTGRDFITKEIQEETTFCTGSSQQILTATEKGLRSPHPHKARIDEVDEIPWSILQTGLSMARSEKGIKGQNAFTSTRQKSDGSMQVLLDSAKKKGIEVYEWNIWETVEKCTRSCFKDPTYGDCPIYSFCKGKAHHSEGFYLIEDFVDKVRVIDWEKFETEWLNTKPAKNRLVYGMFGQSSHVVDEKRLFQMARVSKVPISWQRVCGIDFGSAPGHPFVYLKIARMPSGAWIVFHEYVAEQKLMHEHAAAIRRSPYWMSGERIYADSRGLQERMELKKYGVRTQAADKSVNMGIDYIGSLFKGYPIGQQVVPQLYVWYECKFLISQLGLYSWPIKADGTPDKSGKPEKKNDDACDALRYGLYTHKSKPGQKYRARTIKGL